MCTETGIKDVYRGVQGACPRRAVTHAGGTAERSERRAVGMGLKLVQIKGPRVLDFFFAYPLTKWVVCAKRGVWEIWRGA